MRIRRHRGHARGMLLVLALALNLPQPAEAGFADPLDTPAQRSHLASRSLFNGLAQAGSRLVAVGQRGHVLYSDDAGASWSQATVPVSSDLTAVSFPTERDGWAVGHDGVVLATHDAGATWSKQLDGRGLGALLLAAYPDGTPLHADAQRFADEGPDKPFLDVHFSDAQHGFVVGPFNLLLATDDGGATWTPWMHRTDNPRALHLYAMRRVDGTLYVAGEQGLLLALDAGAAQFRAIRVPYQGTLFGITGDAHALIVYGLRGNALRSTDGGRTWTALETGVQVSLTSATRDGDTLLLATQTGQVLASTDDGVTLAPLTLPQRAPASAVLVPESGVLIVAGPRGLQRVALPSQK